MSKVLIPGEERLGRGVFDSNKAKSPVSPKVFRERAGVSELSVDRLDRADIDELCKLHDKQRANQTLRGWAVLTANEVRSVGCDAVEDKLPENPWHANIVIPDEAANNDEKRVQLSTILATRAVWTARSQ